MNEADTILILRPVADPAAGPGRPARDPEYRLKLLLKALLRGYGFRAVSVAPARTLDHHEPDPTDATHVDR